MLNLEEISTAIEAIPRALKGASTLAGDNDNSLLRDERIPQTLRTSLKTLYRKLYKHTLNSTVPWGSVWSTYSQIGNMIMEEFNMPYEALKYGYFRMVQIAFDEAKFMIVSNAAVPQHLLRKRIISLLKVAECFAEFGVIKVKAEDDYGETTDLESAKLVPTEQDCKTIFDLVQQILGLCSRLKEDHDRFKYKFKAYNAVLLMYEKRKQTDQALALITDALEEFQMVEDKEYYIKLLLKRAKLQKDEAEYDQTFSLAFELKKYGICRECIKESSNNYDQLSKRLLKEVIKDEPLFIEVLSEYLVKLEKDFRFDECVQILRERKECRTFSEETSSWMKDVLKSEETLVRLHNTIQHSSPNDALSTVKEMEPLTLCGSLGVQFIDYYRLAEEGLNNSQKLDFALVLMELYIEKLNEEDITKAIRLLSLLIAEENDLKNKSLLQFHLGNALESKDLDLASPLKSYERGLKLLRNSPGTELEKLLLENTEYLYLKYGFMYEAKEVRIKLLNLELREEEEKVELELIDFMEPLQEGSDDEPIMVAPDGFTLSKPGLFRKLPSIIVDINDGFHSLTLDNVKEDADIQALIKTKLKKDFGIQVVLCNFKDVSDCFKKVEILGLVNCIEDQLKSILVGASSKKMLNEIICRLQSVDTLDLSLLALSDPVIILIQFNARFNPQFRDNIRKVNLSLTKGQTSSLLSSLDFITHLDVSYSEFSYADITKLNLNTLKVLTMDGIQMESLNIDVFLSHECKLETLRMRCCGIKDIISSSDSTNFSILDLDLGENFLKPSGIVKIVEKFSMLVSLSIQKNNAPDNQETLTFSRNTLYYLNLRNINLQGERNKFLLNFVSACDNLRVLDLSFCNLDDSMLSSIIASLSLPEALYLNGNNQLTVTTIEQDLLPRLALIKSFELLGAPFPLTKDCIERLSNAERVSLTLESFDTQFVLDLFQAWPKIIAICLESRMDTSIDLDMLKQEWELFCARRSVADKRSCSLRNNILFMN
ncbi:hypothetical protein MP638_003462 [Amoeboaphelidium occidentale]|nr:hypothetical protein MP638_003462 [Amoeboaphelidium occidentale]